MIEVRHQDAEALLQSLDADSIGVIFTDPPYARRFLPLYELLAQEGARVLRPGGFVLAMGGGLMADVIIPSMSRHMRYLYTFHVALTGSRTGKQFPDAIRMPIISRLKPIYCFVKGKGCPRSPVQTPYLGSSNDKRFPWGFDMNIARYYLQCFAQDGDRICDPMVGGGTVPVVCRELGFDFIGGDYSSQAVYTTRRRLAEEFYLPPQNGQLTLFDEEEQSHG